MNSGNFCIIAFIEENKKYLENSAGCPAP